MREVYFRGMGYVPAQVITRYLLQPGTTIEGPCVIEEPGSTTLVEPGMTVNVLEDGQLVISL
jgi:N-methylhydantoinase A